MGIADYLPWECPFCANFPNLCKAYGEKRVLLHCENLKLPDFLSTPKKLNKKMLCYASGLLNFFKRLRYMEGVYPWNLMKA